MEKKGNMTLGINGEMVLVGVDFSISNMYIGIKDWL